MDEIKTMGLAFQEVKRDYNLTEKQLEEWLSEQDSELFLITLQEYTRPIDRDQEQKDIDQCATIAKLEEETEKLGKQITELIKIRDMQAAKIQQLLNKERKTNNDQKIAIDEREYQE